MSTAYPVGPQPKPEASAPTPTAGPNQGASSVAPPVPATPLSSLNTTAIPPSGLPATMPLQGTAAYPNIQEEPLSSPTVTSNPAPLPTTQTFPPPLMPAPAQSVAPQTVPAMTAPITPSMSATPIPAVPVTVPSEPSVGTPPVSFNAPTPAPVPIPEIPVTPAIPTPLSATPPVIPQIGGLTTQNSTTSLQEEPTIERVAPPEPEPPATDSPEIQALTTPSVEANNEESVTLTSSKAVSGKSVEDMLVSSGDITQEQLDTVRTRAISANVDTVDLLVSSKLVSEQALAKAKAAFFNVPYIDVSELGVSPEALSVVDQGTAQRYILLPFEVDKDKRLISIAMANPLDLRAIDFIEQKTGYTIKPHLAIKSNLEAIIPERYSQSLSSEVTQALKESSHDRKKVVDVTKLGEVIREAPIAKIVETILTFAIKGAASDVHIEPQEDKTRVRYRIDGILHEKLVLPRGVHDAVVSRIKILADLKIDEKRLPQDGRFTFSLGEQQVDLRVSTLPTVNGEKVVMRLLKKTSNVPTLQDLGLKGLALKNLESAIVVPHGIILITGPTGSGKTTTLYAILSKINTPKVNIVTLEDPVEYEIPGVNQVQINPKAGLTFASGLRSFLRQDPNIIQVGEIRDEETAELAIQASLTGHLVFSTLHTNSASGAIPRLMDMKAESFLLASSMTCIVGQRVVRKICKECKTSFKPENAIIDDFKTVLGPLFDSWIKQNNKTEADFELSKGEGCSECNDTGYSGRIAIFEVLPVTEKIAKLIIEHAPASKIEDQAIQDGMILMKMDGYMKVLEGITSIEEVLRVAEI